MSESVVFAGATECDSIVSGVVHILCVALVFSMGLLVGSWVGYPLCLALLARLTGRFRSGAHAHGGQHTGGDDSRNGEAPFLHVVLSAYNEASVIKARLANLEEGDYPSDRMAVHLGTDGCTDDTADIVRAYQRSAVMQIYLYEFPENRGKPAVLKDLVAAAKDCDSHSSSLLVFTDANTMFRPEAMRRLVSHFRDSSIGGVCGELVFVRPGETNPEAEGAYWRFETRLKKWESALDSCLGANGAIYAIRPELFWSELPFNTVVDDFVIGMKVRELGYRMVYDPSAAAEETLPERADEWGRRVRIGSGDYQSVSFCRCCLLPAYGWFSWAFWSHKVFRWFTPHLMIVALASSLLGSLLVHGWGPSAAFGSAVVLFDLVSAGSVVLILLWWGARLSSVLGLRFSFLSLLDHFLTMQAALFAGFLRFARGNMQGSWGRTPR